MKGILFKTEQGWNVNYKVKSVNFSNDINVDKIIPLHESEKKFISSLAGDEYKEVEFEVISEYIEPSDKTQYNKGGYKEYAKIVTEDSWIDIMKTLSNPDVSWGTKEAMVREKYKSPIKKN